MPESAGGWQEPLLLRYCEIHSVMVLATLKEMIVSFPGIPINSAMARSDGCSSEEATRGK